MKGELEKPKQGNKRGRKPTLPGRTLESLTACVDPPLKFDTQLWARRTDVSVAVLAHYYVIQGLARTKRRGRNREKIEIENWLKSQKTRRCGQPEDTLGEDGTLETTDLLQEDGGDVCERDLTREVGGASYTQLAWLASPEDTGAWKTACFSHVR